MSLEFRIISSLSQAACIREHILSSNPRNQFVHFLCCDFRRILFQRIDREIRTIRKEDWRVLILSRTVISLPYLVTDNEIDDYDASCS